jgi:hypothetical protein
VIQHGALDNLFDDPKRSFNVAVKSEGTFLDQQVWDKNGHKQNVPGIQIINSPGVTAPPNFPANRGDGLQPGQYVIHKDDQLVLPYLPDPLALGIAVNDPDDLDATQPKVGITKCLFSGTWPDVEPCKIVVKATNDTVPSVKVEGSDLVVHAPQGSIIPLRYSSIISRSAIEGQMAIWQLLADDKKSALIQSAIDGQHWMLTPQRDLVVVHACERPLTPASFDLISISPDRQIGDTFVDLALKIRNHSHSTGQLDVQAHWSEPVDRLSDPEPTQELHDGHVLTCHPFYEEVLKEIPSKFPFTDPEGTPRHELADTKHRFIQYRADASTRYREYFPADFTANLANVTIQGVVTELNVPSSARPDIPQVLYVIPTFRWESNDDDCDAEHGRPKGGHGGANPITSKRIGRGLRVYLSRPWFSSGDGELLGVVLPRTDALGADDAVRRYISEWGSDPLWRGTGPTKQLAASDFANAAAVNSGPLSLAEDASVEVGVVAFNVEFNRERRVWFADIDLNEVSSYTPMVRLALCRYQPDSIKDGYLSKVSRAEFVQLVNDRAASVNLGPTALTVSVAGIAARNQLGDSLAAALPSPTPAGPAAPPGYSYDPAQGSGRIVTAQLENRGPNDGDLEWTPVGTPTRLAPFTPTGGGPELLWSGDVPRPSGNGRDHIFRLVLKEVELFGTDLDVAEPITLDTSEPVRGRVVYLDVIPLDRL